MTFHFDPISPTRNDHIGFTCNTNSTYNVPDELMEIMRVSYRPADVFMGVIDYGCPEYKKGESNIILKSFNSLKYVPACLAITKEGKTEYFMPILVSDLDYNLVWCYTKFEGSLDDFKREILKIKTSVSVMAVGTYGSPISGLYYSITDLIGQSYGGKKTISDFPAYVDISNYLYGNIESVPDEYINKYSNSGDIMAIAEYYGVSIHSELTTINLSYPFANCNDAVLNEYPRLSPFTSRYYGIRPGISRFVKDPESVFHMKFVDPQFCDFTLKYDVSKMANFDGITENDFKYLSQSVIRCAEAGFAYDKSENYITNITVNKKTS